MSANSKIKVSLQTVHFLIGLAIMLIIRMLPPISPITETGMEILGIFIGTLYLWTTVDPTWVSLFSIFMIGLSSYDSMNNVIISAFGNPTVMQMFFIMIFAQALVQERITAYIGRWFLTRKFTEGKPWLFTFVVSLGCLILAIFLGPMPPIFLFWPVMYDVFAQLGYTSEEKYPKLAVIMVVFGSMLGFPVFPYGGNTLALFSNYRTISGDPALINSGTYLVLAVLIGVFFLAVTILFIKFVFHPDVEKLKNFKIESLNSRPLPPMSFNQKLLSFGFIFYVLCMVLPGWFGDLPVFAFLKENANGLAGLFVAVFAGLHFAGKPVINLGATLRNIPWASFYLCTCAILIGSVLTADSTGIAAFLNMILTPLFTGMGTFTFVILLMVVLMIFTNICNSLVIGMILQPVILSYCTQTGVNAAPIVALSVFFVLSCAMETPAASPFAAMLFGNKEWLRAGDIYKYCGVLILLELALVLLVGYPLMALFL